ncbi:39S ribosomal protein L52, mitochondrial [Aricia agestis]|uniref:39S ribosomal protein L52, mitochondrial n=1 Tax=Aricia agestis TaxID=91739 RepID=UPI001C2059C3|nr:39S ribosomal protein L52, mitochondrial [Aricia agestis]
MSFVQTTNKLSFLQKVIIRHISCSQVMLIKQWRVERGLPINKNAEGMLTDGPDYTFLDGRPTPLLQKQKKRMLQQREFASKIVELSAELDFAKKRYQDNLRAEQEERDSIIRNRLRPKGKALKENK